MDSLLIGSFIAGFLTVLVPCILPLLPVVIGGSLGSDNQTKRNPYLIIASLILSIIAFTLIIKGVSSLFYVPQSAWSYVSATLILIVGISFLFSSFWANLPFIARFSVGSNKALGTGTQKKGLLGDIIIGASLGPVFSSCSPTYLLILAQVLPENFLEGLFYMLMYCLGLGVVLLFIALVGETFVQKLNILASDKGYFKKIVGVIIIFIAILIYTGLDKDFASVLLDWGFIDITQYELDVK